MPKPLAVVPTFLSQPGDLGVLMTCLESLASTADADVLVVDDGSPVPELVDTLEMDLTMRQEAGELLGVELHRKEQNEGFSRTVNVGLRRALEEGRDAVLVNADIEFPERLWLDKMVAQTTEDGSGPASVVGARLLYPSGLIQHGGIFFSFLYRCFDHLHKYAPGDLPEAQTAKVCPVTGALQFIRHECLTAVGLYDENFSLGWEDVDYCIRVFESGRECVYQPAVWAFHYESMFRGRPNPKIADMQRRSWIYFLEKHATTPFGQWVPQIA